MSLDALKWDRAGLVSIVVQDRFTGEIRMLAHANREALHKTLETGEAWFFSRSRQSLWRKGESSGNTIRVVDVFADCDGDALVYLAEPSGPSCHTGAPSCFYRHVTSEGVSDGDGERAVPILVRLTEELAARKAATEGVSYTRSLLKKGAPKIGEKLIEEADELAIALASETDDRVASEAADLLYHAMVGLLFRDLTLRDVEVKLAKRFGVSGHVEKANRAPASDESE